MKKITLLLIVAFSLAKTHAQFVHVIKADSVLITNDSCTAELNLENSTKNIKGFLYNKGNGRTEFRKMVKLNDSTLIFGGDTVGIGGNSKNFANTNLKFTGNRIHDLDGKDLTMKSNWTYAGSEYFQTAAQIRIMGYDDTANKWNTYGEITADYQLSTITNRDSQYYKSVSGYYSSADQVNIFSRSLLVPYYKVNEIYIDTNRIVFSAAKDSLYKFIPIRVRLDTTGFKPLMVDNSGYLYKLNQWPSNQLTLQQVTGYGNSTTNTIKPYPSALPVGASTDSIVVWSATDSLLKKIAPKQTFSQTETVTVTGTTSETTLIGNGTGSLTIPSEAWAVGKNYRVIIHGVYSTTSSSPANINIRLKFGSTVIATSGTIFLSSNKSNVPFTLQSTITCRSTGSSGTIYTFGQIFRDGNTNVINNGTSASTINTTTSQTLNATVQLSENTVGNSVSTYVVILDPIN